MITNWEEPFTLQSQAWGDLDINTTPKAYVLVPEACKDVIPLRITNDDIPQADGKIQHKRFTSGYETTLAVQFWDGEAPACDARLREMTDELMGWLKDLLNNEGRLFWTPTGYGQDRLYDEVRWNETADWQLDDAGFTRITFGLDTRFPYAIDFTETTTTVTGTSTINQAGNTEFWPVLKVYGPVSGFVVSRSYDIGMETFTDEISYSGDTIPGGSYVEIDTFRNTAYLNGDVSSLKSSIVIEDSDFWSLKPGDNDVTTNGPTVEVLWNNAWV